MYCCEGSGSRGGWKRMDLSSTIPQAFCGDKTEEKGSDEIHHRPQHQDRYRKWNSWSDASSLSLF